MSPSFNSFGSLPSVSQLLWDTDLIIPEGKAIESASGEVGIVGDVSVSGSLSADNTVEGVTKVSSALVTATQSNVSNLTVGGYTPTVLASNASIRIGGGLNLIPITLQNVPISGTINGRCQSSGAVTITAYADFYTLTSKSTVTLGQTTTSSSSSLFNIDVSTTVPPKTYAIGIRFNRGDAYFQTVSISSGNYTSKALI